MLKEFIDRQHRKKPTTVQEYIKQTTTAFDECVDFLRDPEKFPNREINQITGLMWNIIGNKDIPMTLDVTGRIPAFVFMVVGKGEEVKPLYILPRNFLLSVDLETAQQLGVISYMASQGRDFYLNKVQVGNSGQINTRAQGYEAEALLTLQKMAENEGIKIEWYPLQQEILGRFPQGLKSLPLGLAYPTPLYVARRGKV